MVKKSVRHPVLLACAIIAAFTASYILKPLPDGVSSPHRTRLILAMLQFISDLGQLFQSLGLSNRLVVTRLLTDGLAQIQPKFYGTLNVTDTIFSGVPVRVYVPENVVPNSAAMVFYHGGGWVFGSINTHNHVTRELAQRLNIVVVSVEYRLAPEFPYPIPLEDCLTATEHFMTHTKEYGVDSNKIIIAGDSAGGNLAASVCQKLQMRDDLPAPLLQVLVYPSLQALDLTLPAFTTNDGKVFGTVLEIATVMLLYMGHDYTDAPYLVMNNHTTLQMKKDFVSHVDPSLLPSRFHGDIWAGEQSIGDADLAHKLKPVLTDRFFMPLMADDKDLKNLPETYLVTAEYDVLRDDGIIYAKRLERSGVNVTLVNYEDGYHGILAYFEEPLKTDVGMRAMDDLVNFIKKKL